MTSNEAMLLYVFANLKIAFIVVIKILNTIVTSMFTIAVLNYPFGDRIGELTFFVVGWITKHLSTVSGLR